MLFVLSEDGLFSAVGFW